MSGNCCGWAAGLISRLATQPVAAEAGYPSDLREERVGAH